MPEHPESFEPDEEGDLPPAAGRRRPVLPLFISAAALLVCAYFLWDLQPALRYWGSAGDAVDLGRPGDYHLERASDNRYARLEGIPGPGATLRVRRMGLFETHYEVVVVRDTNILVRRSPRNEPQSAAPPPFTAQGRLVLDSSIPDYAPAFQNLASARGGAQPRDGHLYVLLDGEWPRRGWSTPLIAAGLLALILLNAAALARYALRSGRVPSER